MSEKKELNNEELDKVTGGTDENELPYFNGYRKQIDKYDTVNYIGQVLYFYTDYSTGFGVSTTYYHEYVVGTLLNSYEKSNSVCGTTRTASVKVLFTNKEYAEGDVVDIELDNWVVYTKE